MKKFLPWIVVALGFATLAAGLFPQRNPGAFDILGFGRLPILANGRIKPMDTVARSSLLQIQGKQKVEDSDGRALNPNEWLLDVFFRPEKADAYPTFVVDNPELFALIGRNEAEAVKRVSYKEISPYLDAIENQAKLAGPVDDKLRTPFQRAVLRLADAIALYQRLEHTLQAPGAGDFLGELLRFQKSLPEGVAAVRAKEAGQPHNEELAQAMIEMGRRYAALAEATNILAIPPDSPGADSTAWKTTGQALLSAFQEGSVDPSVLAYAGLGYAWRGGRADQFNQLIGLFRADLAKRLDRQLRKSDAEVRFNAAAPFIASMPLYIAAFLLAVISWLKWRDVLGRSAFRLVALAWIATTAGILTRMWLEGRPPVTNLYSSALFVGWGAVGLCLILEAIYKNAIGTVAAGLIGFGTLLIAHHLSLAGDTLEMMRAVLDSNFWLATHVVVVTTGYASTFLAGFLALIYILRGVFTKSLDRETADSLARMVYGIVCFATLFSFVGTILGGIWADQSWGRFWGWDPKENGALLIVLWNALILHARWGGLVRQRGLMCLAVFGNIVTSWSWFGTNMLGIGLHSYGFTQAAFWSLAVFVASQLILIAIGNLPLGKWRSFRSA